MSALYDVLHFEAFVDFTIKHFSYSVVFVPFSVLQFDDFEDLQILHVRLFMFCDVAVFPFRRFYILTFLIRSHFFDILRVGRFSILAI